MQNKQDSRNVGIDKTHPTASRGEARSTASPPRTFWLKEWQEAQGILQHVDLAEGRLNFEGFNLRFPPHLSAELTHLETLIGRDVRILRTESPSRIIARCARSQMVSQSESSYTWLRTGFNCNWVRFSTRDSQWNCNQVDWVGFLPNPRPSL